MERGISIPITFKARCQRYYQTSNQASDRWEDVFEVTNINTKTIT